MKYKLAFNNAEKECEELFNTHKEAFAHGVDMGGQWVVEQVETKKCPYCKGKGQVWSQNGPDDVFHDVCDMCNGAGEIGTDTCKGCDQEFEKEELNEDGFCCEECETLYYNPRLLKE